MMSDEYKKSLRLIIDGLLSKIGIPASVEFFSSEGKPLVIAIQPEGEKKMLIGKQGQNLAALDHIIRILAVRQNISDSFVIDIDDYRKSRTNEIALLARSIAERVINTRRAEALPPMSSYERRLVHMELAAYQDLHTESIGQEPRRRIVVKPQSANAL